MTYDGGEKVKTAIEKAYAKINWYLAVGERRADGYHDILSLMQTVSLCDTVSVTYDEIPGIRLICNGNADIPTDARNLAWIAAERYFAYVGKACAVTIEIEKRIPVGAGLAGGSADAAAVLRAINQIFDDCLSFEELLEIAGGIGSDIPFCLVGGLAVTRGRGELLTQIDLRHIYHLVLVNMGEYISTSMAYAFLDKRPCVGDLGDCAEILSALSDGEAALSTDLLRNDFSPVILPLCPCATAALARLQELGGVAQMSGSGSTVFAVFPDERSARAAAEQMTGNVYYATTCEI